jgi:hypothetical protein
VNALPRGGDFGVLEGDPLPGSLPGLAQFAKLYHAIPRESFTADASSDLHWLGGDILRAQIEKYAPSKAMGIFFDFSHRAGEPLDRADWLHCPCLAIDGVIVAMSMPDPPQSHAGSKPQAGRKPGALGILLPGFSVEEGEDGTIIRGAAAPEGLKLPAGYRLDEEGFVVRTA